METCRICGKTLKDLNSHLRRTHKMVRSAYERKFPDNKKLERMLEEGDADRCALCNKIVKNLGAHLNRRHNMKRADYDAKYGKQPIIVTQLVTELPSCDDTKYGKKVVESDEDLLEEVEGSIDDMPATVEQPIIEEPVVEEPVIEEPFVEEPLPKTIPKRPEITLREFLEEYGITEESLRSFLDRSVVKSTKVVKDKIARAEKDAILIAEELKDDDTVKTPFIALADLLIKKYGFRHVKTISKPKKAWILEKIKKK